MSNDNKTPADVQPGGRVRLGDRPKDGEVLVEVSGLTGSGKSAIAGEIEILCRALGLEVDWINGDEEKRLTHADWIGALEMYKPKVVIVERNVSRSPDTCHQACEPSLATAARAAIPFVAYAFSEGVDGAEEAGRSIEAALSAQPSPGGQGDAVRCGKCKDRGYVDVDVDVDDSGSSIGNVEACPHCALSAKPSPGGHGPITVDDLSQVIRQVDGNHTLGAGSLAEAILAKLPHLAARQPVGELNLPPDGFYKIVFDDAEVPDESFARSGALDAALRRFEQISNKWNAHLFVRFANNTRDCTVPNAKPAQAVDLGAVREAVRKAWQKCAAGESVDLQFGTLLALIDSMAAGK
ncbi:hypothetical protein [Stenotrophomonas maltophilia]|uniref:hypothetical protein n=1 Tax=Stenotrophomonas maltophilia TaxID=40324 RepID=UPI00209748FF|nr:hypothetical protein [Stenotrophomonas maltophilia]MCO7458446.1 hypothetical protein [Stenotrophomonas maltophilia]MCO7466454.1 hypothetical protein [Stenotrophomonas maltophilia]MCO7482602.1 hypothetical protein [Stenotrophomonas maltophilia]MCO7491727.1 hypothetical protein [Stenotrophomonas maltophilia]